MFTLKLKCLTLDKYQQIFLVQYHSRNRILFCATAHNHKSDNNLPQMRIINVFFFSLNPTPDVISFSKWYNRKC